MGDVTLKVRLKMAPLMSLQDTDLRIKIYTKQQPLHLSAVIAWLFDFARAQCISLKADCSECHHQQEGAYNPGTFR